MSSVARKGQVGIASVACLQAEKYRARVVFEFVGCCTGGLAAILRSCVGRLANTSGEFRVRQRCVMDLNHGGSVSDKSPGVRASTGLPPSLPLCSRLVQLPLKRIRCPSRTST